MNTITKAQILESEKLATLYAGEMRGKGYTPGETSAVTTARVMRFEFQNGCLNRALLPAGKLASWARTFPDGTEFDLEFSPECSLQDVEKQKAGRVTISTASSRATFLFHDHAKTFASLMADCPPIRFDDDGGRTRSFNLIKPDDIGDISSRLKSQKSAKAFSKLREKEIAAKRALKLAAKEHCARLTILAGGIAPAIGTAKLQLKALRMFRAAIKSPQAAIAWLGETIQGEAQHLTAEHWDLCVAIATAKAAVGEYKPRMVTPRWGGKPRPQYGPKFHALESAVQRANENLIRWIEHQFDAECEKNGITNARYKYSRNREFSRARLAAREFARRKALLAEAYVDALNARRKAQAAALAAGGLIVARAILEDGQALPAVPLTIDSIPAQLQKAADKGATVEILESNLAAYPVGLATLPTPQAVQADKHAVVLSVERNTSDPETYPFFVTGLLTTNKGRVESFAWRLPNLNWPYFDWSQFAMIRNNWQAPA